MFGRGARHIKNNPLQQAILVNDSSVMETVRSAIQHENAILAFQPVVVAAHPDRVAFYEGLIRVLDGSGRIVPARDFMAEVENTELGRELDCIALKAGFDALEQEPALRLAINLSARSIGYAKWMRILKRRLDKSPHLGERLILEICEESCTQVPEIVSSFMAELRARDVTFALDDFGSGVTSFRNFRQFQFDILKIDGTFIRNIADDPDSQVITRAITAMAKQLDMFCVAENVERQQDADLLCDMGVDCLQGYHFAAPTIDPPWAMTGDQKRA